MGSLRTVEGVGCRIGLHFLPRGIAVGERDAGLATRSDHGNSVYSGEQRSEAEGDEEDIAAEGRS